VETAVYLLRKLDIRMSKYTAVSIDPKLLERDVAYEESITDTGVVLTIELNAADGTKFVVSFDDYISYRKIDEGDAFHILQDISETSQLGLLIYRVDQSEFIEWLKEENLGVRDSGPLKHFCVLTLDSVIDVIAYDEPKIY
jgi:hypothetical protein